MNLARARPKQSSSLGPASPPSRAGQMAKHMPDATSRPDGRALVAQAVQWFSRCLLVLDRWSMTLAANGSVQEKAASAFDELLSALAAAVPQLEDNAFALPLAQVVVHSVFLLFKCFGVGGEKPMLADWKEKTESWHAQITTVKASLKRLGPDLLTSEVFVQLTLADEGISLLTNITTEGLKAAGRALLSIGK